MQTVNYSRVLDTIESLAGVDDFNSAEKAFIKSAFNRRVRMAYEESNFWPRFVKEELRYAWLDNTIPEAQSGKYGIDVLLDVQSESPRNQSTTAIRYDTVRTMDGWKLLGLDDGDYLDVLYEVTRSTTSSDAETSLTGEVKAVSWWMRWSAAYAATASADENGVPLVTGVVGPRILDLNANESSGRGFLIYRQSSGVYLLKPDWGLTDPTGVLYVDGVFVGYLQDATATAIGSYMDGEWHQFVATFATADSKSVTADDFHYELNSTNSGAKIEVELADVRVYTDPIDATLALELWNNPTRPIPADLLWAPALTEYWCSFKRQLTDTYGDGSGETALIPIEFYEYGVHGAYADWLRAEGQTDKAMAEERFAREHLQRQLERIHTTNLSPYLWSRFSTHGTRQRR